MVQNNLSDSSLIEKSNKDGMIQKNVEVQIKPNTLLGKKIFYLYIKKFR